MSRSWKTFVQSQHFFGQPGKPDKPQIKFMDFLYIAEKKSIPKKVLKIGITGGDRKLGTSANFLWSWELVKPRMVEDLVKKQLKLFRSGWLKDSQRKYAELPLYGNYNSDYDDSPYEYTTEVFQEKIDLYTLISLVRLNILAVYADAGLIDTTKDLSELLRKLSNTPFQKIQTFGLTVESENDFFVANNKLVDEDNDYNIDINSIVLGRKIENNKVYYLFISRSNDAVQEKEFKWSEIELGATVFSDRVEEFMIGRVVYYKDLVLGEYKIIGLDENYKWILQSTYDANIRKDKYAADDINIKLLDPKNFVDLQKEYAKLNLKMEMLYAYTKKELLNEDLNIPMQYIDIVEVDGSRFIKLKDFQNKEYLLELDSIKDQRLLEKFNNLSVGKALEDSNNVSTSDLDSFSSINLEDSQLYDTAQTLVGKYIKKKWDMDDGSSQWFEGKIISFKGDNTYDILYCKDEDGNYQIVEEKLYDEDRGSEEGKIWYIVENVGEKLLACLQNYDNGIIIA